MWPWFRRRVLRSNNLLMIPIILVLVFSLIEFVRLAIAWGTLQYAADVALRFGTGGEIAWDIFEVDSDIDGDIDSDIDAETDRIRILDAIVPCIRDADARGLQDTINGVRIFSGGRESLFATWYDGIDCDPDNENHTRLRRDLLRIVTMIYVAREAAAQLFAEANPYTDLSADDVRDLLYSIWAIPSPEGYTEGGYFHVDVCSTREFINTVSAPLTQAFGENLRYVLMQNSDDLVLARIQQTIGAPESIRDDYRPPYCMLNEYPRDRVIINAGSRWMDAGDSNDDVTIIITYNHAMIAPLLNQNLVRLETRLTRQNDVLPQIHNPNIGQPTIIASPSFTPTATATQISPPTITSPPTLTRPPLFDLPPEPSPTAQIFIPVPETTIIPSPTATITPLPYITPRPVSGE